MPETIKALDGFVDIFLTDLKYVSSELSKKYSHAENYFEFASKSILQMNTRSQSLFITEKPLKIA